MRKIKYDVQEGCIRQPHWQVLKLGRICRLQKRCGECFKQLETSLSLMPIQQFSSKFRYKSFIYHLLKILFLYFFNNKFILLLNYIKYTYICLDTIVLTLKHPLKKTIRLSNELLSHRLICHFAMNYWWLLVSIYVF